MFLLFVFFFFQAEDGIRDRDVTGVQTCALPISRSELVQKARQFPAGAFLLWGALLAVAGGAVFLWVLAAGGAPRAWQAWHVNFMRSEEHTSELQSHHDLVCRLLLEKKKQNNHLD